MDIKWKFGGPYNDNWLMGERQNFSHWEKLIGVRVTHNGSISKGTWFKASVETGNNYE